MAQVYYRDTEVLSLSPANALAWYKTVCAGLNNATSDFDWQGLAQGAALRARITEGDESLAWAELATSVFDTLAKQAPEKSHDHSEMYCRAAMIEKLGVRPNDDILDPEAIFNWFREKLPTDYSGTVALIGRLADELTDEFVTDVVNPLRAIKNRLNVIKALPEDCDIPDDVIQFVELYRDLP